jgi:hypothetical protein
LGWLVVSVRYAPQLTPCLFKLATDLPCPACGTTRAVAALWHGDWRSSWSINPLGFPALAGLVVAPIWQLCDWVRGSDSLPHALLQCESALRRRRWLLTILLATIGINWAWNILKGL